MSIIGIVLILLSFDLIAYLIDKAEQFLRKKSDDMAILSSLAWMSFIGFSFLIVAIIVVYALLNKNA